MELAPHKKQQFMNIHNTIFGLDAGSLSRAMKTPKSEHKHGGGRNSSHENPVYNSDIVKTAKTLRLMLLSYTQIQKALATEFSVVISKGTIQRWCLGESRNTVPEDKLTLDEFNQALRMAEDFKAINKHSVVSNPVRHRDINNRFIRTPKNQGGLYEYSQE